MQLHSLSSPIGGAAKGMPRNLLTVLNGVEAFGYDATRPSMSPYFVDTVTDLTRGRNVLKMNNLKSGVDIMVLLSTGNERLTFAGEINLKCETHL